jgi:hypothetical protein
MDAERLRQVIERFGTGGGVVPHPNLCTICVEVLHVYGVGISIMSGLNSGPVCSSSERVRRLEDLQFSLGEGPCHRAFVTRSSVAEPDLANRLADDWPNYGPAALDLGACAVFAFPLNVGSGTIGVLTLYQDVVGLLTDEQQADGDELCAILPAFMTIIQGRADEPVLANELSDAEAHRAEVHQAAGSTAVQLGIGVDEALLRIRAHAYTTDQTVAEVSAEILARRLRLRDDGWQRSEPHE